MKKKIFIITGIIILSLCIITGIVLCVLQYNKPAEQMMEEPINQAIEYSDIFYDEGWNKSYVSEIVTDVAVPVGYEYVKGEKDTGLIIKDNSNNYYMWIPYEKDIDVDGLEEYYANMENEKSIDYEAYTSMDLYEGFYISLTTTDNKIDVLKDINDEQYDEAEKMLKEKNGKDEITSTHLISNQELKQVLNFIQKNNMNTVQIGKNIETTNVKKVSNEGDTYFDVKDEANDEAFFGLTVLNINGWTQNNGIRKSTQKGFTEITYENKDTNEKQSVYIPDGFQVSPSKDGIFKIKSETNPNLIYVWVSTQNLPISSTEPFGKAVRDYLLNVLEKFKQDTGANINYVFSSSGAGSDVGISLNPEIEYSIKRFNGFYVAENEAWYDNNGNIATRSCY